MFSDLYKVTQPVPGVPNYIQSQEWIQKVLQKNWILIDIKEFIWKFKQVNQYIQISVMWGKKMPLRKSHLSSLALSLLPHKISSLDDAISNVPPNS